VYFFPLRFIITLPFPAYNTASTNLRKKSVASIYNKEIGWYTIPEMIKLMLQAVPRGLIVQPSPMINFVDVGAKSRLWSQTLS
jgi:hypothetical protein